MIPLDKVEIMAPVGSFESLAAAIQSGADSVYFGAGNLNMRAASSSNFNETEIEEIVAICKRNKVKSYLTLNTVMYDDEREKIRSILTLAKISQVDAIIASDFSVIQMAVEMGLEIHASTQCNISNIDAVTFFAKFVDVVVLARELNLKQVVEISEEIKKQHIVGPSGHLVQLEMFIHGALCMAVSGKCYLSLDNYGMSANRGKCLQQCRRPYQVIDDVGTALEIDNEYIMSPKDLCTIGFIDRILKAGVTVLKIEGRGRSPEYVKTVVACYKEAVQSVYDETYTIEKVNEWLVRLNSVYNRGFWDGYYLGRKMGEWSEIHGSQATKRKEYIAKCTNYFSNINVAELLIESGELNVGDELIIIGPTTGVVEVVVNEVRVDLNPVKRAEKGILCSISVPQMIRRSDKVYKLIQTEFYE